MKKVYALDVEFYRMGTLNSFFVAESSVVDDLIGKTFTDHDALGKHSEITITWDQSDFDNFLSIYKDMPESLVEDLYKYFNGKDGYALINGVDFICRSHCDDE